MRNVRRMSKWCHMTSLWVSQHHVDIAMCPCSVLHICADISLDWWDLVDLRYRPDDLPRDTKRQCTLLPNYVFADRLRTHFFTDWLLMRCRRFECRIISIILIPTWRRWFELIWWLKPCNCSAVHCMWLTFGDVSYTCSSHHVIVVVYTTCYYISLCEMNSKLE
jgi:hypothetical protein